MSVPVKELVFDTWCVMNGQLFKGDHLTTPDPSDPHYGATEGVIEYADNEKGIEVIVAGTSTTPRGYRILHYWAKPLTRPAGKSL